MQKKRVLSGIQPTGELHLGNYFGAVKNWVSIQDQYECFYSVVDLHAMTMPYDPKSLRDNTIRMFADLLACGIDPDKSVLFIQSMVPEHTELTWIFNCVTSFGELSRMTQFKDKSDQIESSGRGNFISAGLFTYPVLQAADILIYLADLVPVGIDQVQHLELSRNVAVRFNNTFGELFPEPKPLLTNIPKLVSLADPTKKMSKSLGERHYVGLFEEEESIRKKIRTAVTDVGGQEANVMSPGVENLFNIILACGKQNIYDSLMNDYKSGALKYKDLKDSTADSLIETIAPFRKRRQEWLGDRKSLERLAFAMADKARAVTSKTLSQVKKLTGLA